MIQPQRAGVAAKRYKRSREAGLTLIELMIAMSVLAVGLTGIMAMIVSAVGGTSRNQKDTTSTLLAQLVIEQMADFPASSNKTFTVTDCAGTVWNINSAAGGAPTRATDSAPFWVTGDIDFTQAYGTAAPGNGYQMTYVACGLNGLTTSYDVRWTVTQNGTYAKTVVVAARSQGATNNRNPLFFAIPVQLKTILGS